MTATVTSNTIESLRKALVATVKKAGRQKVLDVRPFGGRRPGIKLLAEDGEYIVVRTDREVIDSMRSEPPHATWRGCEPEDLERWFREARGQSVEILEKFKKYITIEGEGGLGRRFGKFVVAAQAIGLLSPETLPFAARAVITNGLGPFLDSNTGRTFGDGVSQASIAFRAGCTRRTAGPGLQQARKIGILEASGPPRRKQRYYLLPPAKWPKRLHDEMLARLIEDERLIRESREAREARESE